MLKELISLANHLDHKGFEKEADALDSIIIKLSGRGGFEMGPPEVGSYPDVDVDLSESIECDSCNGEGTLIRVVKKTCPVCDGAGRFDSEYEIPAERVPKAVRQDYIGRRHSRNQGRPSRRYELARRMKQNT